MSRPILRVEAVEIVTGIGTSRNNESSSQHFHFGISGAALDVTNPLDIPERFDLVFKADGTHIPCHVIWRANRGGFLYVLDAKDGMLIAAIRQAACPVQERADSQGGSLGKHRHRAPADARRQATAA